jgi:hypothetical protein
LYKKNPQFGWGLGKLVAMSSHPLNFNDKMGAGLPTVHFIKGKRMDKKKSNR